VDASPDWRRVELDPRGRGLLRVRDVQVAVFLVDGTPYALANACPHAGNPLVEGDVLGRTLVCAFHGWRFDLETGACLAGDEPVACYPAEVRDGEVWVRSGFRTGPR
jgi:nitrite reductase/ring-hydroxylating ferredoxin subunit